MAKAKNKDLGTNILYRLVLAVLAVGVPLSAFFSKIIYAVVDSTLFKILSSLQGKTDDNGSTAFNYSIKELVDLIRAVQPDSSSSGMGSKIWASLSDIHAPLICVAVFFALALIIAVTIFIFNIFSKNRFVTLCLSGVGTVAMIAMLISFNAAASPILDGTISLATLSGSAIFGGLLSYVASVSTLNLTSAWYIMLFLFIGMIVWSGAYLLIESGEKKAK